MLEKLMIPVDEVLHVVFGQKLDRGGYIEVVVPAIKMTHNVYYSYTRDSEDENDPMNSIQIDGDTGCAVIPKFCGKKIIFTNALNEDKDLYSKERITYTTTEMIGRGKSARPIDKSHELTFYWRLVKKAKK